MDEEERTVNRTENNVVASPQAKPENVAIDRRIEEIRETMPSKPVRPKVENPYSSVINWDREEQKAAERKQQSQQTAYRMAKNQALADAFKLLAEVGGAFAGADIERREANPLILQSVQDYNKAADNYLKDKDAVDQNRYSYLLKDRAYALEDAKDKYNQKKKEYEDAEERLKNLEDMKLQIELNDREREKELDEYGKKQRLAYQYSTKRIPTSSSSSGKNVDKGTLTLHPLGDPNGEPFEVDKGVLVETMGTIPGFIEMVTEDDKTLGEAIRKGKLTDDQLRLLVDTYPEFFKGAIPKLYEGNVPPYTGKMPTAEAINEYLAAKKVHDDWYAENKNKASVFSNPKKKYNERMAVLNGQHRDVADYLDYLRSHGVDQNLLRDNPDLALQLIQEGIPNGMEALAGDPTNEDITELFNK